MAPELLAVEHDDVVCRLFPHTFKAKAASWYFSLQENSITDWDTFERLFKIKFGRQRTMTILIKELLALRMDRNVDVFVTSECIHLYILCIIPRCLFREVFVMSLSHVMAQCSD